MVMQPAGARRPLLHEPIKKARTAQRPASATRTAKAAPAATPASHKRAAFLLAILALGAVAYFIVNMEPEGRGALTIVEGSEVQWNGKGRIIQVSGPDPWTVLASVCLAWKGEQLQPVRVIATELQPGRLGIARRAGKSDLVTIRIKEDLAAGKWVAGDGMTPLELTPAPALNNVEAETHNSSNSPS